MAGRERTWRGWAAGLHASSQGAFVASRRSSPGFGAGGASSSSTNSAKRASSSSKKVWSSSTLRARSQAASSMKSERFLRSEEHTSELQSRENLVCRLLLEKKKKKTRAEL